FGPYTDSFDGLQAAPDGAVFGLDHLITAVNPATGDVLAGDTLVVRLDVNGVLDTSFGDGGAVTLPPIGGPAVTALAIAIQPRGKPLVLAYDTQGRFVVVRLLID